MKYELFDAKMRRLAPIPFFRLVTEFITMLQTCELGVLL